jgi:signal transduction histidine kinase
LKRKEAVPALLAALVLLALLVTFAIELANTQANNRADVRTRVHQRGTLAGALIDGLFGSVTQSTASNQHLYGGRLVSSAVLEKHLATNVYMAVLGPNGAVLAATPKFASTSGITLHGDPAVALVQAGAPYGLGNLLPSADGGVINFAVPVPTPYGKRILVSGFKPSALGTFLAGDLKEIPGVSGERNYIIDGNGAVLASTNGSQAAGARFSGPHTASTVADFSRDQSDHYFDEVRLAGSAWRIVLDSPDGPLYASVSGLNKWLPWLIFAAFAVVGAVAFVLVRRVLTSSEETRVANSQLELVNRELETSNDMLELRAAELARSNEELDQFASIASHDLQEPLRKVRTFTQELTRIEGDNLSDKGRDYLRRANAAAERMQNLIEDLLKFSRVGTHARAFSAVDLDQVVRETLEDLSDVIEGCGAVIHVGALPTITAEAVQMRQLVQNLISNALKFQRPDAVPEVWIDSVTKGNDVTITVRDNGIGFDERYAARIFRVFERLHGRTEYPGTGIGLALCRKITERHGGTITAESVPGEGATFTITLPARATGDARLPSGVAPAGREEANV